MSYNIVISKSVQKQINDLPSQIRNRIIKKIQSLAQEPLPSGVVKLKGSSKEYRIRIGDYRVRYEIDERPRVADRRKGMRELKIQAKLFDSCSVSIEEMSIESK